MDEPDRYSLAWDRGTPATPAIKCIDCGAENVGEPDFEGFVDCFECGAAWIPGVAQETQEAPKEN